MTARVATDLAAFRAQRTRYIGGTDIAGILGVSSWASPLSVYLDKTEPAKADDSSTLAMRRGIALERFISDEFQLAKPGLVCWHPSPVIRTDWGFPAGASIDFFAADAAKPRTPVAVVETKTAFRFGWRDWDVDAKDLPDAYFIQVQWYLAVTELELAYGAADVGDDKLRIIPITADAAVQKRLIEAGREFWTKYVAAGIAPEPIGTDADHDALTRMYSDTIPSPAVYIEGKEATAILSDYIAYKFRAEENSREAETAKQRLQMLMGEHEQAVVGKWRLTWKRQTKTLIDATRLKAERPEIAAEYVKTSESRPFGAPKEITDDH